MKQLTLEVAAILALALAAAGVSWQSRSDEGTEEAKCDPSNLKPGYICFDDATALENVVWVDARPRELWEKNGFPGSVLLTDHPSEDWPTLLAEAFESLAMADHVVVYCATEGCGSSAPVSEKIHTLDLLPRENVFVLAGGWKALREPGGD